MLQDLGHRSGSHTELSRERRNLPISPSRLVPDVRDLFVSELGAPIPFSARIRSPLPDHVLHVVGMRSEKEMLRVDARGVVAAMAYLHPLRNGSVEMGEEPTVSPNDARSAWFQ